MNVVTGWFVAYLARWLPHAAPTGLFPIGTPDEDSPVLVTANFSLTVRRVKRSLRSQNVWLLVVNTSGINVWCAAAGGKFTEHQVIDAVKVSRLAEQVKRHELILPALAATGIDRGAIRRATGFHARFGPVRCADLPRYLANNCRKTEQMCRFPFDWRHRWDMLVPMNFPFFLPMAVLVALFWPACFWGATLLFWAAAMSLYLLVNVIPGKTGWGQALLAAGAVLLVWAAWDAGVLGSPLRHWGWFLATLFVFLAAGFDLAGIATPRKSDPEQLMIKLRFKRLGHLYSEKTLGTIRLERDLCKGCGMCGEICPLGVFGAMDAERKTTLKSPGACFACGACVKQCPEGALRLSTG